MNRQLHTQVKAALEPSFRPVQTGLLQRQCACGQHAGSGECEECRKKREGTIQRAAVSATSVYNVPPIVHEVLNSPGQPLDAGTRAFMEPRFGHDFSRVRVHTDARAAESARVANALAYTVGKDIVFGTGQYVPGITEGKRLLAHELTHVVQQASTENMPPARLSIGNCDDMAEREADRNANGVLTEVSSVSRSLASSPMVLSRAQDSSQASTSCIPRPIDLTKIPNVMDAKGWTHGAALLREWFANSAGEGPPDTTTINMDWVLGFSRAKKAYDTIFHKKIYVDKEAQRNLSNLLKKLGKDKGGTFDFFYLSSIELDLYSIEEESVGYYDILGSDFDDLMTALGRFDFKVVVGGELEKEPGKDGAPNRFKVSITDVGVFVWDSFDFNKFQPLGCWNVCTNEVGRVSCGGGELVFNSDFRSWREKHGQGGDFKVFSDVKITPLESPDIFYIT